MQNPFQQRADAAKIWTANLIQLACTVFLVRFGQGLLAAASTNFFVDVLGLSGKQVLWLNGIREIPGLFLIFIAALLVRLPLSRRAALAVILMGTGYSLYAVANSYASLIAAVLIASFGFHNWGPLNSSLGLSLTTKENSGRVLGSLGAVGSLAAIVGMGTLALLSTRLPLRAFIGVGGMMMVVGGIIVSRLPTNLGGVKKDQPRLLLKRRYWLYYVLTFFEGCRTQVFGSFGTLVLVQNYGLEAGQISLILLASAVVNLFIVPRFGRLIDCVGECKTLTYGYLGMALCFAIYATAHNVWALAAAFIGIQLLVTLTMGLSTYVNRIALPGELTPTLTAGVSFNHISSVSISFVAGTLLSLWGYETLSWIIVGLIMLSVPFAMALKIKAPTPQSVSVAAK